MRPPRSPTSAQARADAASRSRTRSQATTNALDANTDAPCAMAGFAVM